MRRKNTIKYKLLIFPGYIIGISCLFLITYRTMIAFFSDSKAVTVYINKFGEQIIDIFALILIWAICTVGLIILIKVLKEEKTFKNYNFNDRRSLTRPNYSFYNTNNDFNEEIDNKESTGCFTYSSNNSGQGLIQDD